MTAHKGARHGLKLSGKLSRLEQQDKLLTSKLELESYNLVRPEVGIFKNAFTEVNIKTAKAKKLESDDDANNSSDHETIEQSLYCHEYSKKGRSKRKENIKIENKLVAGIHNLLGSTENDKQSNDEKITNKGQNKSLKTKHKQIKQADIVTEQALKMLTEEREANEEDTQNKKQKKTKYQKSLTKVENNMSTSKKRKRLKTDSDDTSEDETEYRIEEINEKMAFVQGLSKIQQIKTYCNEHEQVMPKKSRKKRRRIATTIKKKCKKLVNQLEKNLELS